MQNRHSQSMKKQRGFTAIELFVVIIVGLGLFIYAANNIDKLFGDSDTTEEVRNVQSIFVNTKSLKTSTGYGAASTNLVPSLIAIGGIPKNMSVVAGVPYNNWNGAITVVSGGANFVVTDPTLPADACVKLATKISKGGIFANTAINGNAAITGEVPAATASTQCNSAANTIVWTSAS